MKKSIVRVKSGKFSDNAFVFCLPDGEATLPLDKIKFVSLGIIKEEVTGLKPEMSGIRKKLRQVLMGEDKNTQKNTPDIRTTYFIDIILKDSPVIYRFDSSYINYKNFLEETELISINNFKKFVAKFRDFLGPVDVTPDFRNFSENNLSKMLKHESVFDFEIYNANYGKKDNGRLNIEPAENEEK